MVYAAEHESLKSRVALKVIHPRHQANQKYLRRFQVEAQAAARLHHTNIVTVFDYGEQGGVYYYAMQFIQGQPLDAVLADVRQFRSEWTAGVRPGASQPTTVVRWSAAQGLVTGRFASVAGAGIAVAGTEPLETTLINPPMTVGNGETDRPALRNETGTPPASPSGSSSLSDPAEGRYFREVARRPGSRCA